MSTEESMDRPPSVGLAVQLVVHAAVEQLLPPLILEAVSNVVRIAHIRPDPAPQDYEQRKDEPYTMPKGVPSEYVIYDLHGNEITRGKYTNEDGTPLEVTLPPEHTLVEVHFGHDNDKNFEIVHEPRPHGLTDPTPPATPEKLAGVTTLRIA